MKKLLFATFITICTGLSPIQDRISLKAFAEEAMSKSLIGNDPIIVGNAASAKIYSKIDLHHPFWNNLKREELIIINKNSDLVELFWGEQAKQNGLIVYKAAHYERPNLNKTRFVLNGKEISRSAVDTLNMQSVKDYIVLKSRKNDEFISFINLRK